jgi:hypothetical protein
MRIRSLAELNDVLRTRAEKHYVYILRYPDDVPCHGDIGTPFYVGIGQRDRIFTHEEAALLRGEKSEKADAIRSIVKAGKEIVYTIDSFHFVDPFLPEAELIHKIGRKAEGKGTLLNAQTYAPSAKIDGVEVRKYAEQQAAAGGFDALPEKFKLRNTKLVIGPKPQKSRTSVMGRIYSAVKEHPGITGEELVKLLQKEDYSGHKSAYTQSGIVCASWLVGYVDGACFHPRAQIIQPE